MQVAMVGPQEGRECNWFGSCLDHADGTYTCAYNLTLCGTYTLRVEDASGLVEAGLYDSWTSTEALPEDPTQAFLRTAPAVSVAGGAPTALLVRPGPTYAPKSFVYDEPDWLTGTDMYVAHKGVPAAFMLRAADFWGCPRSVGGDDWEVRTYGRHETEGYVDDLGDGRYKITYVPHLEGRTHLAVTLDGVHVDTDNGFHQVRDAAPRRRRRAAEPSAPLTGRRPRAPGAATARLAAVVAPPSPLSNVYTLIQSL